MSDRVSKLPRQQSAKQVTGFDINRVQSNISKALDTMQVSAVTAKASADAIQKSVTDVQSSVTTVQSSVAAIQASALQFVSTEPATSTSPGTVNQAWVGPTGVLKICVAPNSWFKFTGAAF